MHRPEKNPHKKIDKNINIALLFDIKHSFKDKIICEQFRG